MDTVDVVTTVRSVCSLAQTLLMASIAKIVILDITGAR